MKLLSRDFKGTPSSVLGVNTHTKFILSDDIALKIFLSKKFPSVNNVPQYLYETMLKYINFQNFRTFYFSDKSGVRKYNCPNIKTSE